MLRRLRFPALFLLVLSLLGAGTVATTAAAGGAPSVRIVKAPPSRTSVAEARFRFKVAPARARTWCKLDGHAFRRCRTSMSYRGLRARRHAFVVRAKVGRRTRSARHRWTVVAPASQAAAPPAADVSPPTGADGAPGSGAGAPAPDAGPVPLFSEDFDGTSIDPAVWELYNSAGHGGSGLRRPSAIALDGHGNLVLTAQMRNGTIVSGGMSRRVDQTYGRFAFRVRAETDPTGTMNAVVLTWPREQWSPEFTENDMFETGWHANNNYRFSSYIHFGTQNWQHWFIHEVDPSQWHIVEMDWRADRIAIYRDGALAWETTDRPAIPDIRHHLSIQLDALVDRSLARPVRMYVDWVRIYA